MVPTTERGIKSREVNQRQRQRQQINPDIKLSAGVAVKEEKTIKHAISYGNGVPTTYAYDSESSQIVASRQH